MTNDHWKISTYVVGTVWVLVFLFVCYRVATIFVKRNMFFWNHRVLTYALASLSCIAAAVEVYSDALALRLKFGLVGGSIIFWVKFLVAYFACSVVFNHW